MGKKKPGRKARGGDEADDETSSFASSAATLSDFGGPDGEDVYRDEGSALDDLIDALYEKRATTRETALKGIIAALTRDVLTDTVESRLETLLQQLVSGVKKGAAAESALASRAIGILALTMGAGGDSEHIWQEAGPHLTKLAKQGNAQVPRIAALEALAVTCFVGAQDAGDTEGAMTTCWQIAGHRGNATGEQKVGASAPAPALKAAGLGAWSLLLSSLPSGRLESQGVEAKVPALARLLRDADLGVRTAAGETIALLLEAGATDSLADGGESSSPDEDSDSEGGVPRAEEFQGKPKGGVRPPGGKDPLQGVRNGGGGDSRQSSPSKRPPLGDRQEDLVEEIRQMSVQARKKDSKRERAAQKNSFRELLASIEEGGCGETTIKLRHGDRLTVGTWEGTVQLNAMRKMLGEGFQRHLQENPLLHQVFEFQPRQEAAQRLQGVDKRLMRSPNSAMSKWRTQAMNRRRSNAAVGSVGHYGDDDD